MNKLTRNLILPAAALAALLLAPTSEAQGFGRDRGHEARGGHGQSEYRRGYAPPVRGHRYAVPYRASYRAPYRVASGIRFYPRYPGPRYVYVTGFGWTLPPFFGAVWVPGYYDIGGFWVEGFWR
jgi:hypothetical protein